MFHGTFRTMGLVVATGVTMASFVWADNPASTAKAATDKAAAPAKPAAATTPDEVAVLETSKGRMVIEFWDKDAPKTVANFKKLAKQSYFDGTGFHRIIKGFMIQGGDPKSKNPKAADLGTGDPGYKIQDEFNSHKHIAGVISMANSGTPNSAGSQFFIMHGAAPFLDGKYTAFGHVVDGMPVLNEIAMTPVGANPMMGGEMSKPLEWTTLKTVKIVPKSQAMAKPAAATTGKAAASGTAPKKATAPATPPKAAETPGAGAPAAEKPAEPPKEAAPADSAPTK